MDTGWQPPGIHDTRNTHTRLGCSSHTDQRHEHRGSRPGNINHHSLMESGQLQAGLRTLFARRTESTTIRRNSRARRVRENPSRDGRHPEGNKNSMAPRRVRDPDGSTNHLQRERPRPLNTTTDTRTSKRMENPSHRPSLVTRRQTNGHQAGRTSNADHTTQSLMQNQHTDRRQRRRKPPPRRNERGRTTKTIHSNEQAHNPGGNNQ